MSESEVLRNDWGKQRKTSVKIVSNPAEILTPYLFRQCYEGVK